MSQVGYIINFYLTRMIDSYLAQLTRLQLLLTSVFLFFTFIKHHKYIQIGYHTDIYYLLDQLCSAVIVYGAYQLQIMIGNLVYRISFIGSGTMPI